jgi:Tol biopolymer transport system component
MSVEPGQTLSHYRLIEKIGEGGMGVVWKAVDTRLEREVAIKILPEEFARDPDRLSRFEREAKLLASLNHPNIAAIHGLEQSDEIHFLALELVPGNTLAEMLEAEPLSVDSTLQLALQIAEALEAAHGMGVIHRDLKPANIKVTDDGQVKILDFGLAKALENEQFATSSEADLGQSPTVKPDSTREGSILGTAAYMSPEQARGRPLDRRADIWAFGCVLYEMLTGRQAFEGETLSDTLVAVLNSESDWSLLPGDTPPGIRRLLGWCLNKELKHRFHAIADARVVIEETLGGAEDEAGTHVAPGPAGFLHRASLLLAALVVGGALAGLMAWILWPSRTVTPLRKFEIAVEGLHTGVVAPKNVAISPDGRQVAYISNDRLWVQQLDRMEPRELPGTEQARRPFWSPDSHWIGYGTTSRLWKVPASGGEPTAIAEILQQRARGFGSAAGAAWGPDGKIVFTTGWSGLLEVPAQGGETALRLEPDPEDQIDFHDASPLPDGRGVLFAVHRKEGIDSIGLLAGREMKELLRLDGQSIRDPIYSPSGHILYERFTGNQGIWAVPFSLSRLEVTGEPFVVAPNGTVPSVSADGTLVYIRGKDAALGQLVRVEPSGRVEETIGQPGLFHPPPAISPDGRQLAVAMEEHGNVDLWLHDAARDTRTRLTFALSWEGWPAWSPSGDRLAFEVIEENCFSSSCSTIAVKSADGTGELQKLVQGENPFFSPDGQLLLYAAWGGSDLGLDLWYLPLDGSGGAVVFLKTAAQEFEPRLSPDGRYLAYVSNESGRDEIYLASFPSGEGKWQVSDGGGRGPRWSLDGDRLFYAGEENLMEVPVTLHPALFLGAPREMFTRRPIDLRTPWGWAEGFDASADGERFVMVQSAEQETAAPGIMVVENWFAEFEGRE